MSVICPTITAFDMHQYSAQLKQASGLSRRVHIDLMDGTFAPTKSPDLSEIYMPHHAKADIHLMYQRPMAVIDELINLHPRMVIIHSEAEVRHMHFVATLHRHGIKAGIAILQDSSIEDAHQVMHSFDHVLIFSGHLGRHGGKADLSLLERVKQISDHHPDAEIGWDGGITTHNAPQLIEAGVDVLNVGGFIQNADKPDDAYATLLEVVKKSKNEK